MTNILSIDTSCDETSVAITNDTVVLSNVLWSQASLHAKFGGVYPSLARRAHEERIDWVIEKSLKKAKRELQNIDAIAVTAGPGLAIALEVGITKAKELAFKLQKPLITVNHIEGHLLSVLLKPNSNKKTPSPQFPLLALIASGKHTDIIYARSIRDYELVAHTVDDAVGEALDKAARMLGLGYPGGAILEELAKHGDATSYDLPVPMEGKEERMEFSYSGLKTAMYKLVESEKPLDKTKIGNLAASFQNKAFIHIERMINKALQDYPVRDLAFGGGVSSNTELRKRLRKLCNKYDVSLWTPYTKALCTDNAAMIGMVAYYKFKEGIVLQPEESVVVDRMPRIKVGSPFPWE